MTLLTDIKSSVISAAGAGLTVYATKEDLPTSGLTSGDQAYVTANSRLYVSNGSGWYNVALINATPSLSISPEGVIELATDGSTTTITLTATDSDNSVAGLTYSVESDGSFGGLATVSQDSSVFTITPLSEDSATTTSSTLTFKASDGISFGSGDRTLTLQFKVSNSNYTTHLMQADMVDSNIQVDLSSTNTTMTQVGSVPAAAFSPYHPGGYSVYFDGNDYISVADGAYKTLGSDPWTYECWVYPTSVAAGTKYILGDHASSGSGATTSANIWLNGANFGIFCRTSAGNNINLNESTTRSANQWYHLALVFDQTNLILYVDGTAVITQAHSSGFNDGSGSFSIGRSGDYNGAYYTGYVRDVRLVKGTAVYTSSFTPPTESLTAISGTEILMCNTGFLGDLSTNRHGILAAVDISKHRVGPYDYQRYTKANHGGSAEFNNDVANSYRVDGICAYGTGDFTLEFWIWFESVAANSTIFDGRPTNVNGAYITIAHNISTGLGLYVDTAYRIQGGVLSANQWYHIALSRVSGTTTMYLNGKSIGNFSDSFNYIAGASRPLVGRNGYGASSPVDGYISDLRSVKGTGVYTANFIPPTEPLTDVTNTELLTFRNKQKLWNAAGKGRIIRAGSANPSQGQVKFAGSTSVYFDGNSDYLTMPNDDDKFTIGDQDFTIELWHYPTAIGTTRNIYEARSAGSQATPSLWLRDTGFYYYYVNGANRIEQAAGEITANNWYHVAVTRSGSSTKLFVNGVQKGSTYTDTNTYLAGATNHYLGRHYSSLGSNEIIGYVQDFRFTKGLARYTGNFTPPTTKFDG